MARAVRLLLSVITILHHASSFSVPDTFHLMQTAATSLSHTPLPHVGLLDTYKHTLSAHPLPTKMMTGATLAVCGDAIAQSQDKSSEYDKRRAASFGLFDMAYRALQHFAFPIIVATCHGQFFGSLAPIHDTFDVTQISAMEQTLASQLGIVPFLYYPVFFTFTGVIQGLSTQNAITRMQENFVPLMKRNLLFWIPCQFVQFGYIQEDLQIPFLSVCGLAWTFILSKNAGSTKKYTPEKQVEEQIMLNNQEEIDEVPATPRARAANAKSY
jgi:hypothetical protein